MADISVTTNTNLGPLFKGNKICQKFVAEKDGLCAIALWIATYRKQINSRARLKILDANGRRVIRQVEFNTQDFLDNTWQTFRFDPIKISKSEMYWFCLETDGKRNEAITVWTNSNITGVCQKNGHPLTEAICFKSFYAEQVPYLLDPILFKNSKRPPEIPLTLQEELHHIIRYCIHTKELFFPRLVHLVDAFSKTENVRKVLSIGCGQAYHEAFLACRLSEIQLHATDLHLTDHTFSLQNLGFSEFDILAWPDEQDYDFVFSIECLEHIKDYQLAFRNMAAKVKPGKYLYVSVPFANQQEQQDETLKEQEWESHQHFLPGFTFENLETLFRENGFNVIHSANMFNCSLINNLNSLLSMMDTNAIESELREIGRLFFLDLTDKKANSRKEAVGIRFLGQKIG